MEENRVVINRRKLRHKRKYYLQWVKVGVSVFLLGCLFMIGVYSMRNVVERYQHAQFHKSLTKAQISEALVLEQGEDILANVILIKQLQPMVYETLTRQEKADLYYRVVQVEAAYLGIEEPELEIVDMESDVVSSYYPSHHLIRLNGAYLEKEATMLEGVLHEMYHAYQFACTEELETESDLLFFRQVRKWKEEFEGEQQESDSAEGYLVYYLQDIEVSAREYAKMRVEQYTKLLVLEL